LHYTLMQMEKPRQVHTYIHANRQHTHEEVEKRKHENGDAL